MEGLQDVFYGNGNDIAVLLSALCSLGCTFAPFSTASRAYERQLVHSTPGPYNQQLARQPAICTLQASWSLRRRAS